VLRALEQFQQVQPDAAVHAHLEKNIPVGAGLGGGSSDAAAMLRALNTLYHTKLSPEALQELAAPLGADVPAAISAAPCFVTGIGQTITATPELPALYACLVYPHANLSTEACYQAFDGAFHPPSPQPLEGWWQHVKDAKNDLTTPATKLAPVISEVLDALSHTEEALLVRMSGSGSCCFALYRQLEQAQDAGKTIEAKHPQWWVKTTALRTKKGA
jgi:4-diphosphocytidyl-2C-methyl-D-erythritol 2-phosphate synthase